MFKLTHIPSSLLIVLVLLMLIHPISPWWPWMINLLHTPSCRNDRFGWFWKLTKRIYIYIHIHIYKYYITYIYTYLSIYIGYNMVLSPTPKVVPRQGRHWLRHWLRRPILWPCQLWLIHRLWCLAPLKDRGNWRKHVKTIGKMEIYPTSNGSLIGVVDSYSWIMILEVIITCYNSNKNMVKNGGIHQQVSWENWFLRIYDS